MYNPGPFVGWRFHRGRGLLFFLVVKVGLMVGFSEAINNAVRAGLCSLMTDAETAFNFYGRLTPPNIRVGNELARALSPRVCGPPGPPDPDPPFMGGQCPGLLYDFAFQVTATDSDSGPQQSPPTPENGQALGPLSVVPAELGGQERGFSVLGQGGVLAAQRFVAANPIGLAFTLVPTPAGGGPDNCGNPPPEPQPYVPPPITTPITYVGGDNITYNSNLTINLGLAYVDANLDVKVPVDINVDGTLDLSGEFNFSPSLNFGLGGFQQGPDQPGMEPVEPSEPDPDGGRSIRGVYGSLQGAENSTATALTNTVQPTMWVPRLASISFGYNLGGQDFWTDAIDVKFEDFYIPAPRLGTYTAYRVRPIDNIAVLFSSPVWENATDL